MDQEKMQQMTFEAALARLEEIVGSLERRGRCYGGKTFRRTGALRSIL